MSDPARSKTKRSAAPSPSPPSPTKPDNDDEQKKQSSTPALPQEDVGPDSLHSNAGLITLLTANLDELEAFIGRQVQGANRRQREDAKDVLQDVALQVLKQIGKRTGVVNAEDPLAFMLKIATYVMITMDRRERRRAEILRGPIQAQFAARNSHSLLPVVFDDVEVAKMMDCLPENQREAIGLRYFSGLSVDEIAEKMKRSATSVRSYLNEALKRLRKILSDS